MKYIKELFFITVGCILVGAGEGLFLDPFGMAPGGTTGIAVIIHHCSQFQTGTIIILINIPILIFGWWYFGTKFILRTLYATLISSIMINQAALFVEKYGLVTQDRLLCGAAGGVLMALGMGIIFLNNATMGGSDVIVRALRQKYPHIKTGTIYLVSDIVIITISAVISGNVETAMYAAIAVAVSNVILDKVLYADEHAMLVYIISEKSDTIRDRILNEAALGMTSLDGKGAYTGQKKDIIMCVVKNMDYPKVKSIVKQEDGSAFMIVSGANEVFGYGYKNYYVDEV